MRYFFAVSKPESPVVRTQLFAPMDTITSFHESGAAELLGSISTIVTASVATKLETSVDSDVSLCSCA